MSLFDSLQGILAQYASGTASPQDAERHFQQVAQTADAGTLAGGIAAAMRSDQTPPFAQIVAQLFSQGSADQKAGMLNALLAAVPAEQRARLTAMIPGAAAGSAPAGQAAPISPAVIAAVAQQAEQHNPSVVDAMSGFYAQHPTLVRTLGSAAMMIAMRAIAARRA